MNAPQHNSEAAGIRAAITRLYEEGFNRGRLEIVDEMVSPRLVTAGPRGGTGPAGFKANAMQLRTAFPDVHFTVHETICESDRIAVYWTWTGTHRGAFAGVPATNKPVRQEGMVMYRFEGGQIVESRVIFDRLGVFQQLGAAPDVSGTGNQAQTAAPARA